jgi:hypothetical protein
MIVTNKELNKEFNAHIDNLVAKCPGDKTKAELFHEFMANEMFNCSVDENYFYEFTLAFEEFLYFTYRMDTVNFKYFDLDRFYF